MMSKNRKDVLQSFLDSDALLEQSDLKKNELGQVNFGPPASGDILIEALKKLVHSYCNDDAEVTIIRNVNVTIEESI